MKITMEPIAARMEDGYLADRMAAGLAIRVEPMGQVINSIPTVAVSTPIVFS